jgi:outer membrane receptor protein involved in Fe transport
MAALGDQATKLSRLDLSVDIQNLLNYYPPFVNSSAGIPFDTTNADVLGRTVTAGLTKRW